MRVIILKPQNIRPKTLTWDCDGRSWWIYWKINRNKLHADWCNYSRYQENIFFKSIVMEMFIFTFIFIKEYLNNLLQTPIFNTVKLQGCLSISERFMLYVGSQVVIPHKAWTHNYNDVLPLPLLKSHRSWFLRLINLSTRNAASYRMDLELWPIPNTEHSRQAPIGTLHGEYP